MTDSRLKSASRSLLIVDGNSWMHRAFHAINSALSAPDGQPTNAVFGFLSILAKTLGELKPDAVVVAFDAGKPAFRLEALAQYKMQRPPTDPLLKPQFALMEELLVAMNVPVVKVQDWEGDDILGTLSLRGELDGYRVYLGTGDRDAYQLITDKTSVVTTKKGMGDLDIVTPEGVCERYGLNPCQVVDYLGLKGDPSDNIPGVPGIGEKTASRLLREYETLDAVIEAAQAGEISGRAGASLVENKQAAYSSRIVATIARDVPIDLDLKNIDFGAWDVQKMTDAFMKLRMRAPLTKLLSYGRDDRSLDEVAELTEDMQQEMDKLVEASPFIGVSLDKTGESLFDNEIKLGIGTGGVSGDSRVNGEEALTRLCELFERDTIASLNIKSLLQEIYPPDSAIVARVERDKLDSSRYFDVSVAAYLLESSRTDYSLSALCMDYLGVEYEAPLAESGISAVCYEADVIARLAAVLTRDLKADDSYELFASIEMPLTLVLADIERTGVALDVDFLATLQKEGREIIEDLRGEIIELAGRDFNVDSPKQLGEVLFVDLGLPTGKKTKTGFSTNSAVLDGLVDKHPIVGKIATYREYNKLQSTYIEALPRLLATDHRLHTSFNQTVAATGRLSSSNPNLQNIPVRTELGRRIRQAFIPGEKDWSIMSVDYSQIELRVLAHLSHDEGLIEAFTSGADFHAATAAKIFGIDASAVDARMRSRAKAVNFGIVYGQGAHALGLSLGIPIGEAQAMIDRYYDAYPRVKTYLESLKTSAKEQGWVETSFHRKRHIPELSSPSHNVRAFGERTAMNHPMQGTAADLIKLAMIAVNKRLKDEKFDARLLLQVHDELLFEVPKSEIEALSAMVSDSMAQVADFLVPLKVSNAVGPTWAQAK